MNFLFDKLELYMASMQVLFFKNLYFLQNFIKYDYTILNKFFVLI